MTELQHAMRSYPRESTRKTIETTDRGSGAMLHGFGADSTVASGCAQLAARGATLRRNVIFLQRGPTILSTRHSGASWKIAMIVVGAMWLGTVALWMLKEFENHD